MSHLAEVRREGYARLTDSFPKTSRPDSSILPLVSGPRKTVLGEHEGVSFMLADHAMDIHLVRLSIWHTAWVLD